MTTKTRKPRLTKKAIEDLDAMLDEAVIAFPPQIGTREMGHAAWRGLDWIAKYLAAAESRREGKP